MLINVKKVELNSKRRIPVLSKCVLGCFPENIHFSGQLRSSLGAALPNEKTPELPSEGLNVKPRNVLILNGIDFFCRFELINHIDKLRVDLNTFNWGDH